MTKRLFISEADDEQGGFCNTDSKHQYDNTDDFGKSVAAQTAERADYQVSRIDEPFDGSLPHEPYNTEARFNLFYTETDSMDIPSPIKQSPGR